MSKCITKTICLETAKCLIIWNGESNPLLKKKINTILEVFWTQICWCKFYTLNLHITWLIVHQNLTFSDQIWFIIFWTEGVASYTSTVVLWQGRVMATTSAQIHGASTQIHIDCCGSISSWWPENRDHDRPPFKQPAGRWVWGRQWCMMMWTTVEVVYHRGFFSWICTSTVYHCI
jgi:hypothetical protein